MSSVQFLHRQMCCRPLPENLRKRGSPRSAKGCGGGDIQNRPCGEGSLHRQDAILKQQRLQAGNRQGTRLNAFFTAERRRDTGSLPHVGADWHDAVVGVRHMCAGNIPPCEKKPVDRLRNQTPIRNGIACGGKSVLHTGGIKTVSAHVVNVKVEAGVRDGPVGENARRTDIIFHNGFYTLKMARLADADAACHVAGYDARKCGAIEKHMTGRERKRALAERLNFTGGDLNRGRTVYSLCAEGWSDGRHTIFRCQAERCAPLPDGRRP